MTSSRQKGHGIIYNKGTGNALVADGLTGGGAVAKEEVVETNGKSAVRSKAECEAFTTFEDGTSECCRTGIMG